ncbi:MAG: BON domain-containing protein [Acidobacteriia bacterium]|nr:BON domain-containing protein [Terriglobia bacterium]
MRQDVEQEVGCEPSIDAAAIGVAVEDGLVTLSGHVASHAEKLAAEHAAARVRGVKAIVSELEVKLPDSSQSADEEIANVAVEALSWNTQIPADRIKVRVEHGWISLEGDVDWRYQKTAAYNAVCNLKGVKGVSDRVVIKPTTISSNVEAHIEAALRRRVGTRKNHIVIDTSGDHVTLRGAVSSLAERAEIERAAWTTPGVCHVNNNLSVVTQGGRYARKPVERVSR